MGKSILAIQQYKPQINKVSALKTARRNIPNAFRTEHKFRFLHKNALNKQRQVFRQERNVAVGQKLDFAF